MRAVDDVILPLLATTPVNIHDGFVVVDNTTKIVTYDLPYAVYSSSVGDDDNPRLSGRKGRRSVFFSVMYVGLDRNQAKAAGEAIRNVLAGQRIAVPGYKTWLCELLESQRIRRDDDAIRPDGSPLFYGVDNYDLSLNRTRPN